MARWMDAGFRVILCAIVFYSKKDILRFVSRDGYFHLTRRIFSSRETDYFGSRDGFFRPMR